MKINIILGLEYRSVEHPSSFANLYHRQDMWPRYLYDFHTPNTLSSTAGMMTTDYKWEVSQHKHTCDYKHGRTAADQYAAHLKLADQVIHRSISPHDHILASRLPYRWQKSQMMLDE